MDKQPQISNDKLRLLFALLFSSPEAVNLERIRQVLYPTPENAEADSDEKECTPEAVLEELEHFSPRQHLAALENWIAERNLPLVLHQVGRSWRLLTSEEMADSLQAVRKTAQKETLGPAGLEVLALVAYRQPVLKADIDAIRGVKSGTHLRHLLDLRLVRILGRADLPGRPFLYGTSQGFLDRFGLRDLEDLPEAGRLANPAEQIVVETKPDVAAEVAQETQHEPASEPDSSSSEEEQPAE